MVTFLETYLGICPDGVWTVKEGIFAGAAGLVVLLVAAGIIRGLVSRRQRKKYAIFSNTKNKYKSRLGKKNIKY